MLRWHNQKWFYKSGGNDFLNKLKDFAFSIFTGLFFFVPLLVGVIMLPYCLYQLAKPAVSAVIDFVNPPEPTSTPMPTSAAPTPKPTAKPSTSHSSSGSGSSGGGHTTNEAIGPLSRTVYWTSGGKSYHFDPNCSHLARSKSVSSGTLAEAMDAGKTDPCDDCVPQD